MSDSTRNAFHPKDDPRSVEDLINAALAESDDIAWNAVCALHWRGTQEVLDAASALCHSRCPQERSLGADILGQLGVEKRSFPREAVDALLRLLVSELDTEVLESALVALSHNEAPRGIPVVSRFVRHPEPRVRHAVVLALTAYQDQRAIDQLIVLTRDADSYVRDWATFALGTQSEIDTPEIRDALVERLDDSDADTRGEAFVGLARRGDRRVFPALLSELTSGEVGSLSIEAAEMIRAPELHPALIGLRGWWDVDSPLLEQAIAACQPA